MPENGERGNFHKKTYTTIGGCSEVTRYKIGTGDERLNRGERESEREVRKKREGEW